MNNYTPIQLFEKRYRQIKAEYDLKLEKAKSLLSGRQKVCNHKFSFEPDASGNNDSYYQCDYCGMRKWSRV